VLSDVEKINLCCVNTDVDFFPGLYGKAGILPAHLILPGGKVVRYQKLSLAFH
jgi:hypothetical protein